MTQVTYFFVQNYYKLKSKSTTISCKSKIDVIRYKKFYTSLISMNSKPKILYIEPGYIVVLNMEFLGIYKEFFDFKAIVEFVSLLNQNVMPMFSLKQFINMKRALKFSKLNQLVSLIPKEKIKKPVVSKIYYYYYNSNLSLLKKIYIFNQINLLKKY